MANKKVPVGSGITPIKLGLKFTPSPSLLLIYSDKSKLRSRTIPVKELDILTDLKTFTEKFKANERYRKYFDKIPNVQLEKQFFILQDFMKGYMLDESLERAKKYNPPSLHATSRNNKNGTNKKSDIEDTDDVSSQDKKSDSDINDFK